MTWRSQHTESPEKSPPPLYQTFRGETKLIAFKKMKKVDDTAQIGHPNARRH